MLELIAKNLPESAKRMKLLIPYDKAGFSAQIRENGKIFSEEYTADGVLTDALVDIKLVKQATEYLIKD